MLHYKDKAFCADIVKNHTCGRELTVYEKNQVNKLGLPICWGNFCKKKEEPKNTYNMYVCENCSFTTDDPDMRKCLRCPSKKKLKKVEGETRPIHT